MKSITSILLIIIALSACQPEKNKKKPQEPISDKEIQIAKNLIQGSFDDLWAGVDSTKISKYHTNDFIILEQGEIWNNDSIKKYMRMQLTKPDRAKRTNRMEYISIDKHGEAIQIAYYNFAEFTHNDSIVGKAKWLESALAIPTKDGWRLKMMHSTWAGK